MSEKVDGQTKHVMYLPTFQCCLFSTIPSQASVDTETATTSTNTAAADSAHSLHSCIAVYKTQPYDDINLTMTMPIKIWSIQILVVLLFKMLWCQYVLGLPTTPDPFKGDVKVEDTKKVKNTNSTKGILQAGVDNGGVGATPLSTAAESVITFVSVFIVGCVITLSVYSWKRFKPSKGWG